MKKNSLITLLLISAIALTACGSAGTNTSTDANSDPQLADGITRETPLSTQLAIGTLKLEDTDYAVDSDQASNLLPLWQVLKSLTESDSAAQEEITAIVEQIQETMTPEQLNAIDAMDLTGENLFAVMQEMDIATQFRTDGTGRPSGEGFPPEGGFPGGGPGGGGRPGGGFGGDGSQLSPEQIATAQARRAENGGGAGFGNRLLIPLTEAVITLLESK